MDLWNNCWTWATLLNTLSVQDAEGILQSSNLLVAQLHTLLVRHGRVNAHGLQGLDLLQGLVKQALGICEVLQGLGNVGVCCGQVLNVEVHLCVLASHVCLGHAVELHEICGRLLLGSLGVADGALEVRLDHLQKTNDACGRLLLATVVALEACTRGVFVDRRSLLNQRSGLGSVLVEGLQDANGLGDCLQALGGFLDGHQVLLLLLTTDRSGVCQVCCQ
mmetsp:Transcript_1883/g.4114  ORF Transcript_1883/g.4114 Transcript_1883/m.4114 type:complete len:220 (-) Transcript_1883:1559-2218(-)